MASLDPSAGGADAMAAMSAMMPIIFITMLLSLAFYLVIFAGVLKLVIHGEKPKLPFYIGSGADEFRLLGTWVLLILVFIGAYLGFVLVVGAAGFLALSSPLAGGIAMLVAGLAAMVAFCWLMLRMSLATPATIGQRTIGLGPSWNVAKGNVWRLLGYWIIWGLIFMLLEFVIISVMMPGYFQAMGEIFAAAGAGRTEEAQAAVEQMNQASLGMYDGSLGAIARFAAGTILGTMAIVVFAVAGGVAWRLMTDTSPEKHFE
jgi:hypothetical protein